MEETNKIEPANKLHAKNEYHKAVIDEYFVNGFNKVKAVQTIRPGINYNSAACLCNSVFKDKENAIYIKSKKEQLKADASINTAQILKELLIHSFADITDFIGLTVEEIKNLPPEVRRTIAAIDVKKTKYLPRGAKPGEEVEEETIKIKLIDKTKTIDMINKYIGFYDKDNKQKANTINLNNVSVDNLNVLLQVANQVKKVN